ncbi:hypothetical protein like AT5G35090 [Hibiscus trionum]|uniref:Uncharacterized protein n=1 Tax=Hibiscus trionum TaxID=183268 RepID=A0A9W7HVJ4_HIBTR|nr:hypothetical protein like AT5G35090 [Hibiscus trionum]
MCGKNEPTSAVSPSSLKQKLKSSLRLPWLRHNNHHHHRQRLAGSPPPNNHDSPRQNRSSPTCLKSPKLKDKYRNLINRIGNGHRSSHSFGYSMRSSADFRYDPSSYALNFDEEWDDSQYDEFPYRNFTARLPPSPPPARNSTEIAA